MSRLSLFYQTFQWAVGVGMYDINNHVSYDVVRIFPDLRGIGDVFHNLGATQTVAVTGGFCPLQLYINMYDNVMWIETSLYTFNQC